MSRLWPDSLAARFTLVLAAALIVANAVAFLVLGFERNRELRDLRRNSQIERLVTLVPALNALAPDLRQDVVRASSARRLRLRLANRPLIDASGPQTARIANLISEIGETIALPQGKDILMQIRELGGERNGRRRTVVEIAIPLMDGTWLNARQTNASPRPFFYVQGVWTSLIFSFLGVLAVGLLFIRRLTKPLRDLTEAALRVGKGDRSQPLAESGAAEFKKTAHAFNTMQANIDRFNAERMRTVAAVGHDLRTPITSLRLRTEMIADDDLRTPMIKTLDDMTVMADELLNWGRAEGAGEPLQNVDLTELLESICEPTDIKFARARPIIVSGRPVALRRALTNIIDNASRYGKRGVAQVIETGGKAIISVEDEGPGIAPEQLATIFDPFVRGEASRSRASGGAGLGLSIAKTIIESHLGSITIANRSDEKGAAVTVELPIA
ncbi:ATP-binding protein [Pseudahrensia aquimaris]|uniref:histidine kinase n=1 Tax=Pseudahrensia aquimaris TaxID=744461 RepID=A0ABW3FC64_9HYPH